MKYNQDLLKMPVIDLKEGAELGVVIDIIFKLESNEVKGLLVEADNTQYLLPCNQLYSLGQDYIVVKSNDCLKENDLEQFGVSKDILGNKVITSRGQSLGVINDILLTDDGQLTGYELTDGLVQDILAGRDVISSDKEITYREEKIIITDNLN